VETRFPSARSLAIHNFENGRDMGIFTIISIFRVFALAIFSNLGAGSGKGQATKKKGPAFLIWH